MALLEVRNISKKFSRGKTSVAALNNISFEINSGESLGLVGESGCGKSTTAGIIARLIKEDSGEIFFEGRKISGGAYLKPVGKDLQMIFQNPQDSFDPRDTLVTGIMQGAQSYGLWSKNELREKAVELIEYVGLKKEYENVKISRLSGGECQRAAIARALICSPKLIICDEATSALDVLIQAQIIDLLKKLKEDKKTSMLFITHDIPLTAAFCDRIAVMHNGTIAEEGDTAEVLSNPSSDIAKKLLDSVLTIPKKEFLDRG